MLEVYRRQVTAARHMQQQQLLSMGDPAGAVLISEEVKPSEYVNDGYIWLALTHHLLGAGRLEQVGALARGYSLQTHLSKHEGSCWHLFFSFGGTPPGQTHALAGAGLVMCTLLTRIIVTKYCP